MKRILLEKTYHGFEDAADLERDVSELWSSPEANGIPGDFQGRVKVLIVYEEDE